MEVQAALSEYGPAIQTSVIDIYLLKNGRHLVMSPTLALEPDMNVGSSFVGYLELTSFPLKSLVYKVS
jgi:hypothetical protein